MAGGLLETSMPQPIDGCLMLLGRLLCGGQGYAAVMSSHWVPPDLLGSTTQVGGKGLLESVLGVLGLQAESVSDTDTLPSLGMDSMQLVEVSTIHLTSHSNNSSIRFSIRQSRRSRSFSRRFWSNFRSAGPHLPETR
jgi:hypothetical protein